jgi:CBS domain-containing protein
MLVKDLMTRNVVTCQPQDSLATAASIMWTHDCGCVPVVDEDRQVLGMVTDRDICMATWLNGRPVHDLSVTQPMSKSVWTCRDTDPLETAERIMREKEVRRLPVVDARGRLVGILSVNDILREAARPQGALKAREVSDAEVRETLVAVSKPRAD